MNQHSQKQNRWKGLLEICCAHNNNYDDDDDNNNNNNNNNNNYQWHYGPDGRKPPLLRFHSLSQCEWEQVASLLPQHTNSCHPDSTTRAKQKNHR
jgi:hypothetical protein